MQSFTSPRRDLARVFAGQQQFSFVESPAAILAPRRYRSAWISDAHLGTRGCNAAALLDFLRENDFDTLYIVGDLIDIWSLRRGIYWPQQPGEMQTTITLKKVSCGTEVTIVQEDIPAAIPAEACYLGWQESLASLVKLVEPEIPDQL